MNMGRREKVLKMLYLTLTTVFLFLSGVFFLSGCSTSTTQTQTNKEEEELVDEPSTTETNASSLSSDEEENALVPVTQVTGWYAQPERGGQYTALVKDFYKDEGLEMTITDGPSASPAQLVASGQAQFGMVQADEVLIARQEGIPIVAIAALFQQSPYGLIYHKGQPIEDFSDLEGRTIFIEPGAPYWEYIKRAYQLENVKELAYSGQLVNFVSDETSVTQGYITNEPFSLKEQGIEVEYLLVADSGYSPYSNVLFTTEEMIQDQPEIVQAFVTASIKGWDYYKENYEEINPYLLKLNPDYSIEGLNYGAEAQMELVYGGDAIEHGVGHMTEERWVKLVQQMLDLGTLESELDANESFTTQFLPNN